MGRGSWFASAGSRSANFSDAAVLVRSKEARIRALDSVLPLLLMGCVALGRLLTFSGPQFPGLFSGASSASLLGLL